MTTKKRQIVKAPTRAQKRHTEKVRAIIAEKQDLARQQARRESMIEQLRAAVE